jgi:uncharacterized membrane protein
MKQAMLFGLKVGGVVGIVLALITDFFLPLAPIGLWLFLIALTMLLVCGMVVALQPTRDESPQGIWFAPFGMALIVFCVVMMTGYITSESSCEQGCGYLAANIDALKSLQMTIGILEAGN